MFDKYGRTTGYGQEAPGRDVERLKAPRANIDQAIGGGQPPFAPPQAVFKGAQQTIGAQNPSEIDQLFGGRNALTNEQAGYDQGKWNALSPEEQAKYRAAGGAPTPYEQGGITGNVSTPPIQPPADTPVTPTPYTIPDSVYSTPAPSGWDPAKWADKNKHDAKYDMRRVLEGLDPRQGWTPEALARVNSLGYGTFTSDGGDGLNLSGLTDAGRAAGLTGDYQGADFINGFKGDHPTWGYSDPVAERASAANAPQQRPGIQNAILGNTQPTVGNSDYAARLRQQIMQALQLNPDLAAIASNSGY